MKKFISINKNTILSNKKHNRNEPPIGVRYGSKSKKANYLHNLIIDGPCEIKYSPDNPLPCGAKVWIETEAEII